MAEAFYAVMIGIVRFSIGFIVGIAVVMKVLNIGLFIGGGGDDDDYAR